MINIYHDDLPSEIAFETSIAIDSETMGLDILRNRLCLLQIAESNGNIHIIKFSENQPVNTPNLVRIMEDMRIKKIFHFARFDLAILKNYLGINSKNIYCTKIASRLVRTYTQSHGLKDLCRELLNITLDKQEQSSYWGGRDLSDNQIEYAKNDVLYLHDLMSILNAMLIREKKFDLAHKCFEFLSTRIELDLIWGQNDIFNHK